jgi:hypothetical protein
MASGERSLEAIGEVGQHSHGDKCLWKLESHTEAKHRLYQRYVSGSAPILLQEAWVKRVTYLKPSLVRARRRSTVARCREARPLSPPCARVVRPRPAPNGLPRVPFSLPA